MRISEVAKLLFGDHTDASRKRVRLLIKSSKLNGKRLGGKDRSPWWVTRASVDALLAELGGEAHAKPEAE